MSRARDRNYHLHQYQGLDEGLAITGYVIAVHDIDCEMPSSMIGPIANFEQAEMLIALLYDMEEREFHLWPMAAPKELLKNGQ
jgi:hypothetical protein